MSAPLRVLPIPCTEAPIISADEALALRTQPAVQPYVQDALAVEFAVEPTAAPSPRKDDDFGERVPTRSRDLPDPQRFAATMTQAVLEVLAGARPAPQVIRWCSPEVYSALARRALVAARRRAHERTGSAARAAAVARPAVVKRVRCCEVADGVVEAAVVVLDGPRARALALRLTGLDGRWVIDELVIG